MADEPTGEATAETSTAPAAEGQAADQSEEAIDWDSLDATLERAYARDPKVASDRLKKHRAIGGIAGSIAEGRMREISQQQAAQRAQEADAKARADLEDMAQNRPLEFADKFLSIQQAEKTRAQINAVEQSAAMRMMEQIGQAYHGIPEWAELTDDEKTKLRDAVADAKDDALPRFNRAALDIVADRRTAKLLESRLKAEKEAWQREYEGERLGSEKGPDLRRPSSTAPRKPLNWAEMSDKDFLEYWKGKGWPT